MNNTNVEMTDIRTPDTQMAGAPAAHPHAVAGRHAMAHPHAAGLQPTGGGRPSYTKDDFAFSPFVLFYEVTRACDLACKHCRACAQPKPHAMQLSTHMAQMLLEEIASFPKPPLLVFTGGDPMKREDIFDLVSCAVDLRLTTAMTPSATPLVTRAAINQLKDAGLARLAVSMDGIDAATHDGFRGVAGSFDRTLEIMRNSREVGLPQQVNTTITPANVHQVDEMAEMLSKENIVLWSVFFLVPVGRGLAQDRITPMQYEEVFGKLWEHSKSKPYAIKTTEAPHYRRFVLNRSDNPQKEASGFAPGSIRRAPLGVVDGKGVMFVSHTGGIYPSGFMPLRCGHFPEESIIDVYQKSEWMMKLRDSDLLHGKCGVCEHRHSCGGSRARAYAVTGDPLGAEPDCVHVPTAWKAAAEGKTASTGIAAA